jgi:hypothetical protein
MTMQIAEIIYIDGRRASLQNEPEFPLELVREVDVWEEEHKSPYIHSTACHRDYIGTWKIKDNKFYLTYLDGKYRLKSKKPVFAEWYTGILKIPRGKFVRFGTFEPIYEKTLFVQVENGYVIKTFLKNSDDVLDNEIPEYVSFPKEILDD